MMEDKWRMVRQIESDIRKKNSSGDRWRGNVSWFDLRLSFNKSCVTVPEYGWLIRVFFSFPTTNDVIELIIFQESLTFITFFLNRMHQRKWNFKGESQNERYTWQQWPLTLESCSFYERSFHAPGLFSDAICLRNPWLEASNPDVESVHPNLCKYNLI